MRPEGSLARPGSQQVYALRHNGPAIGVECWASILGDCGEGQSGEHYISDGIFDGATVTAVGLPWCRDKPRTIGMRRAVANILCGRHNWALSPFDAEAAKLSAFLRENIHKQPLDAATVRLNGVLIEKWALKTFLNLGYIRGLSRVQSNRIDPRTDLVRYLYRNEPVADGVGLYFITGAVSSDMNTTTGLWWNSIDNRDLNEPTTKVFGMTFTFFGVRFVVNIAPIRAEEKIAAMGRVNDFDFSTASVSYRPPGFTMRSGTAGEKRIEFKW